MTCIAAVKHEGRVHLAGDSLVVDDGDWSTHAAEDKVWEHGPFAMGFAGGLRPGQVVKHLLNPSAPPRSDLMAYMVTTFVADLRKALTEAGCDLTHNDDGECKTVLALLVGVRGRIFVIDSDDFSVCEADEYTAIGSGAKWAVGSLRETKRLAPRTRLQRALSAAAAHSASVGGKFTFVSV